MDASPSPVVLVVLKAPRRGFVKTRLASDLGPSEALRIYRWLVERQLAALPAEWAVEVVFAPADAEAEMRAWLGERAGRNFFPQVEGDLGARLTHAVAGAFARGAPSVLVIGGDCPGLDEATLRAAGARLGPSRLVLGPAGDGGYYLIGLSRSEPHVFAGVPWSTEAVLETSLRRGAEVGLTPVLLSAKNDVDNAADWKRWVERDHTAAAGGALPPSQGKPGSRNPE